MTKISTTVTKNIVVGTTGYTSPLSITSTGAVISNGPVISTNAAGQQIRNSGLIERTGFSIYHPFGVYLSSSTLTNLGTVESIGGGVGVDLTGTSKLVNSGVISGGVYGDFGLMTLRGAFDVENHGTIDNVNLPAFSTITNAGLISSGIELKQGAIIKNTGAIGEISSTYGLFTLSNSGTIRDGITLATHSGAPPNASGGMITNLHNGLITGNTAIELSEGTVINDGTLTGTGGIAIDFTGGTGGVGGTGGLVVDDPGAIFNGRVEINGGAGILELAHAGTGTLTGFGTQFTGFTALAVDPGAKWEIAATTTLGAGVTLTNNGLIKEQATDSLTIEGAVGGSGTIDLHSTALVLNGSVSADQQIDFTGKDTLSLSNPGIFAATITGFAAGDTIDLTGIARDSITGEQFTGGVLTLTETTGSIALTFASPATFSGTFTLTEAAGGTDITLAKLKPAADIFGNAALLRQDFTTVECSGLAFSLADGQPQPTGATTPHTALFQTADIAIAVSPATGGAHISFT